MSLRTLPIDVRPRIGESVEGYIRRLARANHLRPSYLYQYLCIPRHHNGTLQPGLLAEITGRPLTVLERVLPALRPQPPALAPPPKRRSSTSFDRIRIYAAIRRDAETGYSIRALPPSTTSTAAPSATRSPASPRHRANSSRAAAEPSTTSGHTSTP